MKYLFFTFILVLFVTNCSVDTGLDPFKEISNETGRNFQIEGSDEVVSPETPTSRTISFDANGGIGYMEPVNANFGDMVVLNKNTFTKKDHRFSGWSTDKNNTFGNLYYDQESIRMISANFSLYATWTPKSLSTINFYANGGTGEMPSMNVESGVPTNLNTNTFTRAGYTFLGWGDDYWNTVPTYTDGSLITINDYKSLYAVWQQNPMGSVYFNNNGGTGSMSLQQIRVGLSSTLTANSFTRVGYIFSGWITNLGGNIVYANLATITMNSPSLTLYANWSLSPSISSENFNTGSIPTHFTSSGNSSWIASSDNYEGGYSAASGVITHSQSSSMTYSYPDGPKTLTFYWKVSSEANFDYLKFYINNVEQFKISGTTTWTLVTKALTGPSELKWTYSKDGSVTSGSDRGWVDCIGLE